MIINFCSFHWIGWWLKTKYWTPNVSQILLRLFQFEKKSGQACTLFKLKQQQKTSEYILILVPRLKVSKSQNKFMKSSFLPKNKRNIARISALNVRAEILAIFRSFFGRNDDFINLFWDLLTFSMISLLEQITFCKKKCIGEGQLIS